jgi:diacylglycerol kinase (ATP)
VVPTVGADWSAQGRCGGSGGPRAAAELAVTGRHTVRLELADLGGRPFVNVASAGLAPAAARRAAPLKRLLGPLAYPAGALLAGALEQPVACRTDGFDGRAWQVTVAVTGAFGGGAEIAGADPSDGRLDLAVVPAGPRIGLARVGLALRRGEVAGVRRQAPEFLVEVPPETPFNVDGEVVHAGPRARFTLRPGGFALVRQAG